MENGTYHAFVANFGLARAISATRAIGTHTMLSGTPGFQAPEQLKQENVDARCDVYVFGGVLVELFGGRPLWPTLSHFQIMYNVTVLEQFPVYDHPSPALQRICIMCLVKAHERVQMMQVLYELLRMPTT